MIDRSADPRFNRGRHTPAGVVGLGAAIAALVCSTGIALAQSIDENLWITNGTVYSIVREGGTIYIAGSFNRVGPATGGGVPVDAVNGSMPSSFPRVTGRVLAAIPDGSGGWYIGGAFTAVGGV